MSYDLVVFDLGQAPKVREDFLTWYEEHEHWKQAHDVPDLSACSSGLREWFLAMLKLFPCVDGDYALSHEDLALMDEDDECYLTEYSVGAAFIQAQFSLSVAEFAYGKALALAKTHHLGFFNVSSDYKTIILPEGTIV